MLRELIYIVAIASGALSAVGDARADEWTGRDKNLHALGGAMVASSVQQITGSRGLALAAGGIVAVGKELADMRMPGHTPSHKDAIVTFAGSLIATSVPGLSIGPGWIAYRMSF